MFDKDFLNQLYSYACSLTRDEDAAYDLLQSSLERGLKKDISTMTEPLAYLKVVLRNLFFDQERRKKVLDFTPLNSADVENVEEDCGVALEDVFVREDEVRQLIEKLSSTESELLYLWAVEEYTADEIAKMHNQSRNTVLSQLSRLKKRIREEYGCAEISKVQVQ